MRNEQMPVQHITVSRQAAGQKLIQFLTRHFNRPDGAVPGGFLMKLVRTGQVRVDGKRKKPFFRVQEGQVVRIPPVRPLQNQQEHKKNSQTANAVPCCYAPLPVVHKTADWLAVQKPAGLPAHPGSGHDDSVITRLQAMFACASFTPTLAHRLDRDTAGLLLVAMSYTGLNMLHTAFRQRSIEKYYLAGVHGHIPCGTCFSMQDLLEKKTDLSGPSELSGRQRVVCGSGRPARATVTGLWTDTHTSVVAVALHTGRTHQIRVQLASRNLPVRGDKKYGPGTDKKTLMQLHAWKLRLPEGTTIEDRPSWYTGPVSPDTP